MIDPAKIKVGDKITAEFVVFKIDPYITSRFLSGPINISDTSWVHSNHIIAHEPAKPKIEPGFEFPYLSSLKGETKIWVVIAVDENIAWCKCGTTRISFDFDEIYKRLLKV